MMATRVVISTVNAATIVGLELAVVKLVMVG